jgi:preprotein translocase SecE subunit
MTTNLTDKNGTTTPTRKEGVKMAGPAKPAPAKKDGASQKLVKYLQEVQAELKKTTWPDRPKLIASTKVVLAAVIITGFYLFCIDWVLTQVMGFIIGARGR